MWPLVVAAQARTFLTYSVSEMRAGFTWSASTIASNNFRRAAKCPNPPALGPSISSYTISSSTYAVDMEAQLFDAPLHAEQGDAKTSRVWSPYDQLDGHIKITGGDVDTISISLLGACVREHCLSSLNHRRRSHARMDVGRPRRRSRAHLLRLLQGRFLQGGTICHSTMYTSYNLGRSSYIKRPASRKLRKPWKPQIQRRATQHTLPRSHSPFRHGARPRSLVYPTNVLTFNTHCRQRPSPHRQRRVCAT